MVLMTMITILLYVSSCVHIRYKVRNITTKSQFKSKLRLLQLETMLQSIKLTKVLRFLQLTFKATGTDVFSKHPTILNTLFMFVFMILWIINGYLDGVQNINDTQLGGLSVSIIFLTYGLLSFIKFATVNLMKQRYLTILNWMKNLYQPNKILDITAISKDIMRKCLDRSQFIIRYI